MFAALSRAIATREESIITLLVLLLDKNTCNERINRSYFLASQRNQPRPSNSKTGGGLCDATLFILQLARCFAASSNVTTQRSPAHTGSEPLQRMVWAGLRHYPPKSRLKMFTPSSRVGSQRHQIQPIINSSEKYIIAAKIGLITP